MPDYRCYCAYDPLNAEQITLSPEESMHLVAANRARSGDLVRAFDGTGTEWDTLLVEANKRRAVLQIEKAYAIEPPMYTIALAQALPKGKLIESIIRKASEIGIQRLHPIHSGRVEAKLDRKREETKNAKWQAAAIEGAKQSGNPFLLDVAGLSDFHSFLESGAGQYELKLIASLTADAASITRRMRDFQESRDGALPRSAVCLVGPEGDFTPQETQEAIDAGFLPTTLGPYVMRCETAAIAALSVMRSELDLIG